MLSGAHRQYLGELCTNLKNQFGYGSNHYPKTLDACLSLLNHWTPSNQQKSCIPHTPAVPDQVKDKDEDKALVFAQDTKYTKQTPHSGSSLHDDSS
jgi:hypothetical protein